MVLSVFGVEMPPFTQHSDAPQHDTENHGQHSTPTFEDAIGFEPSVEDDDSVVKALKYADAVF